MLDFDKLKQRLEEIHQNRTKVPPPDPLRGLPENLRRKVCAGLAGHRSGVLTKEEIEIMESLQKEYDRIHPPLKPK